jgi:hypothetical protein
MSWIIASIARKNHRVGLGVSFGRKDEEERHFDQRSLLVLMRFLRQEDVLICLSSCFEFDFGVIANTARASPICKTVIVAATSDSG